MFDLDNFLDDYLATQSINTKSLISTFFGDVVVPHGGCAFVETIANAFAPLAINERLVRTTLFRLVEQDWLFATRSGRKSYYQLTELASSQTDLAEGLIYAPNKTRWDQSWTLVFLVLTPMDNEAKQLLEQELGWLGFGAVTKNVWAHPCVAVKVVAQRVKRLGLSKAVVCIRGRNICDSALGFSVDDREMAARCLPVSRVEQEYQQFLDAFAVLKPALPWLLDNASADKVLALRVLLIDAYRRIVLHDPHLPDELLPSSWQGHHAYQLCADIYRQIRAISEHYYCQLMDKQRLQQTPLSADYKARFFPQ